MSAPLPVWRMVQMVYLRLGLPSWLTRPRPLRRPNEQVKGHFARSEVPERRGRRTPQGAQARQAAQSSLLVAAGLACGRAVRATWLMAAKGTGGAARSIGRARDIEPGHRRDGIALVLLGLAVVVAASSWFDAARPVGAWVDSCCGRSSARLSSSLPLVTAAVAVVLMRTQPNPDARPRLILGAS